MALYLLLFVVLVISGAFFYLFLVKLMNWLESGNSEAKGADPNVVEKKYQEARQVKEEVTKNLTKEESELEKKKAELARRREELDKMSYELKQETEKQEKENE